MYTYCKNSNKCTASFKHPHPIRARQKISTCFFSAPVYNKYPLQGEGDNYSQKLVLFESYLVLFKTFLLYFKKI